MYNDVTVRILQSDVNQLKLEAKLLHSEIESLRKEVEKWRQIVFTQKTPSNSTSTAVATFGNVCTCDPSSEFVCAYHD